MTLLTLLAPAPAPATYRNLSGATRGEAGGVASFDLYRVAAGAQVAPTTDAWATAELVYPHGSRLRSAGGGESVTVLTPLAAAISAAQGPTWGRAACGGTGYTALTPRLSAAGGTGATWTTLRAAGGGTNGPARGLQGARGGVSGSGPPLQPARAGIEGA